MKMNHCDKRQCVAILFDSLKPRSFCVHLNSFFLSFMSIQSIKANVHFIGIYYQRQCSRKKYKTTKEYRGNILISYGVKTTVVCCLRPTSPLRSVISFYVLNRTSPIIYEMNIVFLIYANCQQHVHLRIVICLIDIYMTSYDTSYSDPHSEAVKMQLLSRKRMSEHSDILFPFLGCETIRINFKIQVTFYKLIHQQHQMYSLQLKEWKQLMIRKSFSPIFQQK